MFLCQVQHSNPCDAVLQLNYCVWIIWKLLTSVKVQQNLLLSEINYLFIILFSTVIHYFHR